jgi:hypothetical protein
MQPHNADAYSKSLVDYKCANTQRDNFELNLNNSRKTQRQILAAATCRATPE